MSDLLELCILTFAIANVVINSVFFDTILTHSLINLAISTLYMFISSSEINEFFLPSQENRNL